MTQLDDVLIHLTEKGPITSFDAFRYYNITRLAAIIYKLRHEPYNLDITTTRVDTVRKDGSPTNYAIYALRKKAS